MDRFRNDLPNGSRTEPQLSIPGASTSGMTAADFDSGVRPAFSDTPTQNENDSDVISHCSQCGGTTVSSIPSDWAPVTVLSEVPLHGKRRCRPLFIDDATSQYARELCELAHLEAENRSPGADLRKDAEKIVQHPALVRWLSRSEELLDSPDFKGRSDLRKERRRGVLRHLEGEDRGFPLFQPDLIPALPPDQGSWMLRLMDELEWLVMRVYRPVAKVGFARPAKTQINHREVRAILGWKAYNLDMWLSFKPHLIEGRIHPSGTRAVLFDTEKFMFWVYANTN